MTLGERRTAGGPDRVVQNIKRIVCHIVGIFFELGTSGRTRGRTQVKEKKISNRHYRKFFFSQRVVLSTDGIRWMRRWCRQGSSVEVFKERLRKF